MGAYITRRIALMLLLLFLVTVSVFVLFSLVPTDPAALTCGKSCNPQIIEANRERLGLADPLYVQYWEFLKGIFVGRTYAEGTPVEFSCPAPALGYSFRKNECVTQLIADRFPVTAQLAIVVPSSRTTRPFRTMWDSFMAVIGSGLTNIAMGA